MEEGEATRGIGMCYDYNAIAAQAVVDRARYFNECIRNECIRNELKNNHGEIVKSK
jgi:hypothetical protein